MTKKEKKAGSRLALNIADVPLVSSESDWHAFIFFVDGDNVDDAKELDLLAAAIGTSARPRFQVIGKDLVMAMIKENKGSELSQLCKAQLEDEGELSPDLVARLLKLKLMQLKNEATEAKMAALKAAQAVFAETPLESVGSGIVGSSTDLSKARKKDKGSANPKKRPTTGDDSGEGSAGTTAGGADKKKSKQKKMVSKLAEGVRLIEDEPREGPDYYYFIHGLNLSAALVQAVAEVGIPLDAIVRLDHSDAAIAALQLESAPVRNPLWTDFSRIVDAARHDSSLLDIVVLPATAAPHDPTLPKRDGMPLFDATAGAVYGLVDKRRQHREYVAQMQLIDLPSPRGGVDTSLYRRLVNRVPDQGASVAFILDCLVEQVVYTEDERSGRKSQAENGRRSQAEARSQSDSRAESRQSSLDAYIDALVSDAAAEVPQLRAMYTSLGGEESVDVLRYGDSVSRRMLNLDGDTRALVERAERKMLGMSRAASIVSGWAAEISEKRAAASGKERGVAKQEFLHVCREAKIDNIGEGLVQLATERLLSEAVGITETTALEDRRAAEAFDAFTLVQVVHAASFTRPVVVSRYDDKADKLLVALHGDFQGSRDRSTRTQHESGINCPVGFRNYLRHVHGTPFATPGCHGYNLGDSVIRIRDETVRLHPTDGNQIIVTREVNADGRHSVRTSLWGSDGAVVSAHTDPTIVASERTLSATFSDGAAMSVAVNGSAFYATTEGLLVDVSSEPASVRQTPPNALDTRLSATETARVLRADGSVERYFADGSTETYYADGAVLQRSAEGTTTHTHADGMQEITEGGKGAETVRRTLHLTEATDPHSGDRLVTREDMVSLFTFSDGRVVAEFYDGTRITQMPTGHVRIECRGFAAVEFEPPSAESPSPEPPAESSPQPPEPVVAWLDEQPGRATSAKSTGVAAIEASKLQAESSSAALLGEGGENVDATGSTAGGDDASNGRRSSADVVRPRIRPRGRIIKASDGTVITWSKDGRLDMSRQGGFVLSHDGAGTVALAPNSSSGSAWDGEPGTYTYRLVEGTLVTLDHSGFQFAVAADGQTSMRRPFGPDTTDGQHVGGEGTFDGEMVELQERGTVTADGDNEEGSSTALVVAGADAVLGCIARDGNAPRVFCVADDCTGTELLRDCDLEGYIEALSSSQGASVTCDDAGEHDGFDAVTVVRYVPENGGPGSAAASESADDPSYYFEPLVIPIGLRSYMLRDFVRWDTAPSPRAIELRHVRRRPPMDEAQRALLASQMERYEVWKAERQARAEALLIADMRDSVDIAEAAEISALIAQAMKLRRQASTVSQAPKTPAVRNVADAPEDFAFPASSGQQPALSTGTSKGKKDAKGGGTVGANGKTLRQSKGSNKRPAGGDTAVDASQSGGMDASPEAPRQPLWIDGGTAPPPDVPDLFSLSAALPTLHGEAPTDDPPDENGRPTTPTPSALQNWGVLPKIPSIPATPAAPLTAVSRAPSFRRAVIDRKAPAPPQLGGDITPAQLRTESVVSSARSRPRSMDVDVTGHPRRTAVKIPLAVSSSKGSAASNDRYKQAEEITKRKIATASVAVALGVPRGFEIFPELLDMGHVRAGSRRNFTILLRNVGVDTARFRVKPHRDPALVSITYNSGPVAAGMSVKINVQVEVPNRAGPLIEEFTIDTENEIFTVEIRGVVSVNKGGTGGLLAEASAVEA